MLHSHVSSLIVAVFIQKCRFTLSSDGSYCRGGAARRNRENMRLRSAYQIPGSSDNLTRNDDEDGSIGTEGESVS